MLVVVGMGSFMTALDGSVVNIILPVMTRAFRSDVATMQWVVTIYLLVVSGLLLSSGRLGDLYGHRPVYLSGLGVFVLGSASCGLAPTAAALIAFRGLEALGAAMVLANSAAIVSKNFPASRQGQALGLVGAAAYVGLTFGPAVGGWLSDQLSWRAVFFINVPVGALGLLLCLRYIPRDRPALHAVRFDLAGGVTFMSGLSALLLALNQGHTRGWSATPPSSGAASFRPRPSARCSTTSACPASCF